MQFTQDTTILEIYEDISKKYNLNNSTYEL